MVIVGDLHDLQGEVVNFEWKIKDFLQLTFKTDTCYESPTFSFLDASWEVRIFPNGEKAHRSAGFIDLFIAPKSLKTAISVNYTLHLETVDGKADTKATHTFTNIFEKPGHGYGARNFISRSKLIAKKADLLPSGVLTVICTLRKIDTSGVASYTMSNSNVKTPSTRSKNTGTNETISAFADAVNQALLDVAKKHSTFSRVNSIINGMEKPLKDMNGVAAGHATVDEFTQTEDTVDEFTQTEDTVDEFTQTEDIVDEFTQTEDTVDEFTQAEDTVDEFTQTEEKIGVLKLQQHFSELLQNGNASDVVLKVNDREIKSHRCILEARSPVFLAMMTHDTKEKNTGIVDIEDADPNTFSDFLKYLYTGSEEIITQDNMVKLYTAANKYEVGDLKENCLDYMLTNMSVNNFCDILSLSLEHVEKDLTEACSQFFIKNSLSIILTPKWLTFLGQNLVAGNELIIKHMKNK